MRNIAWVGLIICLGVACDDELDDLKPDLLVSEINAPEWIETGDSAPVAVTVWNRGMVVAPAPFLVVIESSIDPGFSTPGTSWTWTELVTVPARGYRTYSQTFWPGVVPGHFYLRATADVGGQVIESVETNNSLTTELDAIPPFQWPDLTVTITQLPTNVEIGTDFWLSYTVGNLGDATSPATLVGIGAMQPLGFSTGWWSDVVVPALAPGQSHNDSVLLNLTAPLVPAFPEMLYIVVGVDYAGAIAEWDETNNADEAGLWAWSP